MTAPPTTPVILGAMNAVVQALSAAGLRVCIDHKDINPPCLYLAPPVLRFRFGRMDYEADMSLLACSSNTVKRVQYEELSDLITRAQDALGTRMVAARPADIWTADQTSVLAAYELSWTDTIRNR